MDSKIVLIFLLIAGAIAIEDNAETEQLEKEEDLEMDFDAETEDVEDYDEVEEEERDLDEDMNMLDKGGKAEVTAFCGDAANAGDPVCKALNVHHNH
jgi:hypothetical protein